MELGILIKKIVDTIFMFGLNNGQMLKKMERYRQRINRGLQLLYIF